MSDPELLRVFLRKLLRSAQKGELADDTRSLIFDIAEIPEQTERVILSNAAVLGTYRDFTHEGRFFPNAISYLETLRTVFAEDEMELCFALKNPATLLSSALAASHHQHIDQITGGVDALNLRWSELLMRIRQAMPDVPITVWYNEDSPLVWRQVLQAVLRLDATDPTEDVFRPLVSLLAEEDFARFSDYIAKHPGMTPAQERRVVATFIDKFADASRIEEAVEIDGWTQDYVDQMTATYEQDQDVIAGIKGVTLIET